MAGGGSAAPALAPPRELLGVRARSHDGADAVVAGLAAQLLLERCQRGRDALVGVILESRRRRRRRRRRLVDPGIGTEHGDAGERLPLPAAIG